MKWSEVRRITSYRQGEKRERERKKCSTDWSISAVYLFFFLLFVEGGGDRAERFRDSLGASFFDAIPFFLFRPPLSES